MRLLLSSSLALVVTSVPASVLAQQAPQDHNFCTHATSRAGTSCPSPSPAVQMQMRRFDAVREQQALRASIEARLATGDCDGAQKTAVDKGRHELAARIRRACKAQSEPRL